MQTREKEGLAETRKKQHVVTVIVTITFYSLSWLSKRKRQINIVIHNFK